MFSKELLVKVVQSIPQMRIDLPSQLSFHAQVGRMPDALRNARGGLDISGKNPQICLFVCPVEPKPVGRGGFAGAVVRQEAAAQLRPVGADPRRIQTISGAPTLVPAGTVGIFPRRDFTRRSGAGGAGGAFGLLPARRPGCASVLTLTWLFFGFMRIH